MQTKEKGNAQRVSGTRADLTITLGKLIYKLDKKMAGRRRRRKGRGREIEREKGVELLSEEGYYSLLTPRYCGR